MKTLYCTYLHLLLHKEYLGVYSPRALCFRLKLCTFQSSLFSAQASVSPAPALRMSDCPLPPWLEDEKRTGRFRYMKTTVCGQRSEEEFLWGMWVRTTEIIGIILGLFIDCSN